MGAAGPTREPLSTAGPGAVPSIADVEAIGAFPHPIPRNLKITQAYHELSAAVAAVLGSGANWCTFATWASRQAGQTIRGDDLGRKIEDAFVQSAAVQVAVARIRDLRRAVDRAADADEVLGVLRRVCAAPDRHPRRRRRGPGEQEGVRRDRRGVLFGPPFTPEQVRMIAAGRTPDGRL